MTAPVGTGRVLVVRWGKAPTESDNVEAVVHIYLNPAPDLLGLFAAHTQRVRSASFDSVRFERVHPQILSRTALAESSRILRPGGRLELITGKGQGPNVAKLAVALVGAGFGSLELPPSAGLHLRGMQVDAGGTQAVKARF